METSAQQHQPQQQQEEQTGPPVTTGHADDAPVSSAQANPGYNNTTTTSTTSNDAVKKHAAATVTISPATSNQNLKFLGDFEEEFPASSLRSAFKNHSAFGAVFEEQRRGGFDEGWGGGGGGSRGAEKFPGIIIAVSEERDLAADAGEGAGKSEDAAAAVADDKFKLTGAPHGLVSAIMTAYNRHCDLVLSPDDVWLTILAQFCAYVNKNAEGLRSRIVEHEGKKELKAYSYGSLETADYKRMIRDLLVEIRKNIKSPELADWFRPGFSTTTEKDEVCAAATAMASLQAYFEYKMCLLCGIPSVTLLGTVADWKLLRQKVDHLLEFEVQGNPDGNVMELWVGYLRKACDGFVESAENPGSAETLEFWDKVLSHVRRGSGMNYITGWLSAFTCFNWDGQFIGKHKSEGAEFPLITEKDICHNVVSCPVKIDDNGKEYDGTLFAGQVVFGAEHGGGGDYPTVRPRNDWCIAVAVKE